LVLVLQLYTEENDKLYIASGSGTPLIKGDFAAKTVDISGSLGVTGSISTSGSNGTINGLFFSRGGGNVDYKHLNW
jgi:hypothetical protein